MNKIPGYLLVVFLLVFAYLYSKDYEYTTCINIKSQADILYITKTKEVPRVIYDNQFDFATLSVKDRKKAFIDMLLPQILIINERIQAKRKKIQVLSNKEKFSKKEKEYLEILFKQYKCSTIEELLIRYDSIPPDIVIAQAAIETGWGTSRFFREANNIFGVWSYNKDEPRIPANGTRNGKKVYLKKYSSVLMSIRDYFILINSNKNYNQFWEMRIKDKNKLAKTLTKYSELGYDYVKRIENIIRKNNLEKFREYELFKG